MGNLSWRDFTEAPELLEVINGAMEIRHCLIKWKEENDIEALQKAYGLLVSYRAIVGENLTRAKRRKV